jgi:acetolactate synthase-1/3 small subunit
MKHILSLTVENKPGVLTRVAGLFTRRGYNIDSLAVGETEDPEVSRITLTVHGEDAVIEQITKQVNKLVDVIKIVDLSESEHVEREMVFIKVNAGNATARSEIKQLADIFRARIVDVAEKNMIIELTGSESKIESMENLLKKYGIKEVVRTGKIAIARGQK